MRYIIVGIVIGGVIGVMLGTTTIAPRLNHSASQSDSKETHSNLAKKPTETTIDARLNQELAQSKSEKSNIIWRMASAYSGDLPQLGSLAKRVSQNIWKVSNGKIELKFGCCR